MAYASKIIADSMSPHGHRITSFEVTMPRIVLAEFNTHRVFSRNSASSRAIPIKKMLEKVDVDPFIPEKWPKNGKGMQPDGFFEKEADILLARAFWLDGRDKVIEIVKLMEDRGIHKQVTNRLLEPFLWHTIIVTATEWSNAFNLRRDKHAQEEIRRPMQWMFEQYNDSQPEDVDFGQWHLPLVKGRDHSVLREESFSTKDIAKISCGRCGRVSYLTHEGQRDPKADVAIVDEKFSANGHMSPLEHAARPMYEDEYHLFTQPAFKVINVDGEERLSIDAQGKPRHFCGNVEGWIQYRKLIPGEDVFQHMQL